jgi:hypothetical protein
LITSTASSSSTSNSAVGPPPASRYTCTVPPVTSGTKSDVTVRSNASDVKRGIETASPAPYVAAAHITYDASASCSMTTPFGVPVEPDVYNT